MPERRSGGDDAFAALVLRFLDGAVTPDEEAALNAELMDPARRDLYVSICRQRGQLAEVLTATAVRRRTAPPAPRRWMAAAAALLLVAGGTAYYLGSGGKPEVAVWVERTEGDVARLDGLKLSAGMGLPAGEGLETGAKSRAVLRYDDGTRVEIAPLSQVRGLESVEGKRLRLERGSLRADVVPQPSGRPMLLRTPAGEARVLGTVFSLSATGAKTRLDVEKGLVRLTRLSDRKSADVAAGQYALASAADEPVARSVAPAPAPSGAALVASMVPNSWLDVPGTKMLKVAPDPARTPDIQGRMGAAGVVAAWSGGAFDLKRRRLVLWGGGYVDYHGNELYGFNVDSMEWERISEPTRPPALGKEFSDDGRPTARATFNGLAYLAGADRLFALGGSVAGNGYSSCHSTLAFDFDRKAWTNRKPSGAIPPSENGCCAAYDPVAHRVWWGDGKGIFSYDPEANRWTKHGDDEIYYCTSVVDPKRRLWIAVGRQKLFVYDLSSGRPVRQAWTTTGGDGLFANDNPGLDYDPVRDRVVGWAGGAVYALDADTKTWTAFNAPGAPAPTPNGIYGRWRYLPGLDVFIVVTSAMEDVHVYKPGR